MPNLDEWLLARGERGGFPMIVRMACAYRGMGPLPRYDHHIIVAADLRAPTPAGLPSAEEGDDLQRLEENLCNALETDQESLCVLVITNQGKRDFIFYTRNPDGAKAKLDAVLPGLRTHGFEIAIEPDDQWEIYRAFDGRMAPGPARPN